MADQKNRGGQKQSHRQPGQSERKQGTATRGAGERSARDKRHDQMSNPEAARQPTNERRKPGTTRQEVIMSHHKKRHGPGPVPPSNLPQAGPQSGEEAARHAEAAAGGGAPFQEQDPKRRIGDYEQEGEHSLQQPSRLNDGQQHSK